MVGAVIGSYRLIRKLGEGGMGAVYLGQHQLLGRRAAIKVLLPELSARPDIVNRFFNEARAVTSISDPGIVQVFDFGYHADGSAFIVMEYLEGEPLDRRLARLGRLPAQEVLRLARQLAISLAAAHAQQIVHRDLKPENVFLVHDAEVASGERSKILDFGIAKLSDNHPGKVKTSTGALMGTPMYMSPEQCRGLAEIDHRSDIYSLGCVLYHLLTGRPPFDAEAPGDIIVAHIREPAPAPSSRAPDVPPSVDALVLRCLAKAPGDRFQSMAELTAVVAAVILQLQAGAAAPPVHHMLPTTQLAATQLSADRTPVPPSALTPGAGIAPPSPTPTTLGTSAGQFASTRTAPPMTPVPAMRSMSASRDRRVGLWIAGGLIVAAAVTGIAIVGTGSGGARIASRPDPGSGSSVVPVAEPTGQGAPAVRAAAGVEAEGAAVAKPTSDPPPAQSAPAPSGPTDGAGQASAPRPAVAPAAAKVTVPAAADAPPAADHAAANGSPGPRETGSAGGDPQLAKDPARSPRDTSSKKPARHKRPAVDAAPDERSPTAAATTPASGSSAVVVKPGPGQCSKAVFAAVYNAAAPSKDAIRAAIRGLNACHTAGAISDADFDETQTALVARF